MIVTIAKSIACVSACARVYVRVRVLYGVMRARARVCVRVRVPGLINSPDLAIPQKRKKTMQTTKISDLLLPIIKIQKNKNYVYVN